MLCAFAQVANADTLTLAQYRARLAQARGLVAAARTAAPSERDRMVAQASALLRQTTAITVRGVTITVDDGELAAVVTGPDGANRGLTLVDAEIAAADRTLASRVDPETADARVRDLVGTTSNAAASATWLAVLVDYIAARLAGFFAGLRPDVPDLTFIVWVVALLGLSFVAFLIALLGRGTRERIRREVLVPGTADRRSDDPLVHLRSAETALAGGRAREAIHELYLYAIRSLAAREILRYDPTLTDRELLLRAAAIPNADALGDLVALYERAWFGLRDPSTAEAERARSLARRIAP
jgi:hypothetical protein